MQADFNEVAREWAKSTAKDLRRAARQFRKGKSVPFRNKIVYIRSTGNSFPAKEVKLQNSITSNVNARRQRVQFVIAYHSKFVEIGAGRGRRVARPVFSAILTPAVDRLADEAATREADLTVKKVLA